MELTVATVASAFLLAGMGSVMFIARQIAYTPSDTTRRAKASDVVSQISDELRYATAVIQQSSRNLEFLVADRNSDGTAEKIRYEWSGIAGAPLRKTVNGTSVDVLPSVNDFTITLQQAPKTTTYTTTTESSEQMLLTTATPQSSDRRDIDTSNYMAQVVRPSAFSSIPANALSWNLTKLDYYGRQNSSSTETLAVQFRHTGDPNDGPTSNVLGQLAIPESSITGSDGWNTAIFAAPVRNLSLSRNYSVVFAQLSGSGQAARIPFTDSTATGVSDSTNAGASWQYMPARQCYVRVYGTYNTPGPSYNVTRNYVSSVRIALQSGSQGFARVDASAPLRNRPELLSAFWRTDFDRDPTLTNGNGDNVADWALAGGGTFDTSRLVNGIWMASGAIETRPLADFTTTTTIDVRCRNTTAGGNGAVVAINADCQGGQYAPILVYLQRQADGSQTLTLNGKTSASTTTQLFSRTKLSGGFVRYQLTILPNNNLVNLQINGEDQGTYSYPTYAPSGATDGYLTAYADSSTSDFDYVDVRVGMN